MSRALIVTHGCDSRLGRIGRELRARGFAVEVRCPREGYSLPHGLGPFAVAVVLGGPMSANDDEPYLRREIAWLADTVGSGGHVLGICLGAQLLARAMGASVAPHPAGLREIGYRRIVPTSAGRALIGAPLHVYQWHREGFALPDGAELLATGSDFTNQAFRYRSACGVQFHPEATRGIVDLWTREAADQLALPGAHGRDAQLADSRRHDGAVGRWLREFLDRWLPGEAAA